MPGVITNDGACYAFNIVNTICKEVGAGIPGSSQERDRAAIIIKEPEISILTSDVNGVKNSPEMVKSVAAAAERAGVPYKVTPYPLGGGGSNAGSFSQAGLKATTLFPCKFPQQIVAFYPRSGIGRKF